MKADGDQRIDRETVLSCRDSAGDKLAIRAEARSTVCVQEAEMHDQMAQSMYQSM